MGSLNYSIAQAMAEKLNDGSPVIPCLEFNEPQFVPMHCHAYVPSNLNNNKVYSWIVCGGATLGEGQDRCSSIWVWNLNIVLMKRLECLPDKDVVQPASIEELDALMQYSEWCINQIGDTQAVQNFDGSATANVVGIEVVDMPNQDMASQGMWVTEIQVTLHGRK